jgi:hypothetical protein
MTLEDFIDMYENEGMLSRPRTLMSTTPLVFQSAVTRPRGLAYAWPRHCDFQADDYENHV